MTVHTRMAAAAAVAFFLAAAPTAATETRPEASLSLELNDLSDSAVGCRATFIARNALPVRLDAIAFEVVLFDADGRVDRLLVLDFGSLAPDKTRVRQFELQDARCDGISRVLVNDAVCRGVGVEPHICIERLETSTRAPVEFGS